MSEQVMAEEVRVGDVIEMMTVEYWWRWGFVTRINKSSTGRTIHFEGETDRGNRLYLTKRSHSIVERRGHRKAAA